MKFTYLDIMSALIFSQKTLRFTLIALASIALMACGGGGGSSDKASSSPVAAQPNPDSDNTPPRQIVEDAETSMDIQVPQGFTFSDHQHITFTISAMSPEGNPIADTAITIYKVPNSIDEWQDDYMADAELILKGRLNDLGVYSKTLEVPGDVNKVLVRLAYIGMENFQLVEVQHGSVNHQF